MSKSVKTELVVEIVKAYIAGNPLPAKELPELFKLVRESVSALETSTSRDGKKPVRPAVAIRKSLSRQRLVCLEDGKKFKLLKRHLRTAHGLTPDEYRARWGLEERYPMVAPAYSAQRSRLAAKLGLGRSDRRRTASRETAEGQLTDAA